MRMNGMVNDIYVAITQIGDKSAWYNIKDKLINQIVFIIQATLNRYRFGFYGGTVRFIDIDTIDSDLLKREQLGKNKVVDIWQFNFRKLTKEEEEKVLVYEI